MPDQKKPNILIIWGDDIGWFNVSMNNNGIMGYRTPNIDRVAKEGCNFTDWYGQQSCTAGRAAFITGQSPIRTGLTKVGLPGADLGLQPEDPTIADVLKPLGYVSGQFGKNHLGDRDEFLPTAHGFDEFFGNLYHLNAEQEPECPDYPQDPEFKKKYGPRGVLHTWANADFRKASSTVSMSYLAALSIPGPGGSGPSSSILCRPTLPQRGISAGSSWSVAQQWSTFRGPYFARNAGSFGYDGQYGSDSASRW